PPRRSAFSYTTMSSYPVSRSLMAARMPAIPAPITAKRRGSRRILARYPNLRSVYNPICRSFLHEARSAIDVAHTAIRPLPAIASSKRVDALHMEARMEFGVFVATKIDDWQLIRDA